LPDGSTIVTSKPVRWTTSVANRASRRRRKTSRQDDVRARRRVIEFQAGEQIQRLVGPSGRNRAIGGHDQPIIDRGLSDQEGEDVGPDGFLVAGRQHVGQRRPFRVAPGEVVEVAVTPLKDRLRGRPCLLDPGRGVGFDTCLEGPIGQDTDRGDRQHCRDDERDDEQPLEGDARRMACGGIRRPGPPTSPWQWIHPDWDSAVCSL
jgi:hypothetical protein